MSLRNRIEEISQQIAAVNEEMNAKKGKLKQLRHLHAELKQEQIKQTGFKVTRKALSEYVRIVTNIDTDILLNEMVELVKNQIVLDDKTSIPKYVSVNDLTFIIDDKTIVKVLPND